MRSLHSIQSGSEEKPQLGGKSKRLRSGPPKCTICGYDKYTEMHRIIPGREGGKYVGSNVIELCALHHKEADLGLISREELFEILDYQQKLKEMQESQEQSEEQDG